MQSTNGNPGKNGRKIINQLFVYIYELVLSFIFTSNIQNLDGNHRSAMFQLNFFAQNTTEFFFFALFTILKSNSKDSHVMVSCLFTIFSKITLAGIVRRNIKICPELVPAQSVGDVVAAEKNITISDNFTKNKANILQLTISHECLSKM